MSQPGATATFGTDRAQLDRLCTAIRGKLQFMDYLVRAAAADVARFEAEADPGTRIFLRQLIEMHTASLNLENENMRLVSELCAALESAVNAEPTAPVAPVAAFRNGDAA